VGKTDTFQEKAPEKAKKRQKRRRENENKKVKIGDSEGGVKMCHNRLTPRISRDIFMFLNMIYDLRETGLVAAAAALQTIVVGGGAAGMMAAISAARSGRKVALLEGNSQLGRKILISGNGRCNLTNLDADSPHHYHGERPEFVRRTLASFPLARSLEFFHALGIETKQEKRGRLFPRSDQARSVVDLLIDELAVSGVRVATDAKAPSTASPDSPS
jgi:hypothetical protein